MPFWACTPHWSWSSSGLVSKNLERNSLLIWKVWTECEILVKSIGTTTSRRIAINESRWRRYKFSLSTGMKEKRANTMHLICLCAECGPTVEANLYTFISVCEAGSCPILTSFFWCCIHLPKCSLSCTTNRKRRNSIFLSLSCCDLFWTQSLRNFSHKHANEYLTKNNCEIINDCWASLSGGPTKWNIENFFWRINYWIRIYSIGYSMVRVHVGA